MIGLAHRWEQVVHWVGDGTGLPDTIIHVHAGMIVLLAARLVTRRSLGTWLPLSCVAAAEMGNELLDRISYGSSRWVGTLSDVGNTLFWPTVICLAVRLRPLATRGRDRVT